MSSLKKNFLLLACTLPLALFAQSTIQWQHCYGGSGSEFGAAVIETSDSGYAFNGSASSIDGDVTGLHVSGLPQYDMWIVKTDNAGNIQWNKCLGSTSYETGTTIRQTPDGGFIAAGESTYNGGDVTGNHNNTNDYWVVKLDAGGNLQWQKCLGGNADDAATNIIIAHNSYVVTGVSNSIDYDVTGNNGMADYWVVKIDSVGNIIWEKSYGGSSDEVSYCVIATLDSGFMVCGQTNSNDSDVTNNHGFEDCWIIKLDSLGNLEWQKTYGGGSNDIAYSVIQLGDNST